MHAPVHTLPCSLHFCRSICGLVCMEFPCSCASIAHSAGGAKGRGERALRRGKGGTLHRRGPLAHTCALEMSPRGILLICSAIHELAAKRSCLAPALPAPLLTHAHTQGGRWPQSPLPSCPSLPPSQVSLHTSSPPPPFKAPSPGMCSNWMAAGWGTTKTCPSPRQAAFLVRPRPPRALKHAHTRIKCMGRGRAPQLDTPSAAPTLKGQGNKQFQNM